jgi:hypothetical protein
MVDIAEALLEDENFIEQLVKRMVEMDVQPLNDMIDNYVLDKLNDELGDEVEAHIQVLDLEDYIDIDGLAYSVKCEMDIHGEIEDIVDESYITDRLDLWEIASSLDTSSIADEVVSQIDLPSEMAEAVTNGCNMVEDIAETLYERSNEASRDGGYEEGYVVLTAEEYHELKDLLAWSKTNLNVEDSFEEPLPPVNQVAQIMDGLSIQDLRLISGASSERLTKIQKNIRAMRKQELIDYCQNSGLRVDTTMTMNEMYQMLGLVE